MKRPAYILMTFIALLPAMQGCDKEGKETGLIPVSFATFAAETRAGGEQTADNMTSMGVFAYYTKGLFEANATTATPNYMCNQPVVKEAESSAWGYSPLMYWPAKSDEKISFFAYAPHSDEITANGDAIAVPVVADTGLPKFAYTNNTGQTDLLIAAPLTDRTSTDGEVRLAFSHALTKVTIKVKSTDNTASRKVLKSLSVVAARQGTLSYKATSASGFLAWSDIDVTQTAMSLPDADGKALPATSADAAVTVGAFYLIPNGANATLGISYAHYEEINGTDALITSPTLRDIAFTNADSWLPGASVTYLLSISLQTVTLALTDISWESMNLSVKSGSVDWETGETFTEDAADKP